MCITLNVNELCIPTLSLEESEAYIITAYRTNINENMRTGVQPNIWEAKHTENGTLQSDVTELVPR